jgi:predicted Na+-dependent transporter
MHFLKKNVILIIPILLGIVLIGKISNWFLDFSDETNQFLNTAMFSLIGVAYLTFAWAFDKILSKIIFLLCGIYVITMNFIPDFGWWKTILGIICLVTPLIIRRFLLEEEQEDATP